MIVVHHKYFTYFIFSYIDTEVQVQIADADNTAQYWPNLGSQQSVIGAVPVSSFASVKCWAEAGGLCRL